jgi:ATP-binding cassette subfamily A (ABC1) protein 3
MRHEWCMSSNIGSFRVLTCRRSWHISISIAYIPGWITVMAFWKGLNFTATSTPIMIGFPLLTGYGHPFQVLLSDLADGHFLRLSLASWSLFVSVPFGKSPQLAAISTTLLAFLFAILALVLSPHASIGPQMIFTLFFPSGFFVFVMSVIAGFEATETPTSATQPDPQRGGRIVPLFLIAIVNIFLYPCLAIWWERSLYGPRNPTQAKSWFPWSRAKDEGRSTVAEGQSTITEGSAIEIRNLNKTFDVPGFWPFKPARIVTAIEDLSLSIPRHGIFVLLGANGAGKSTALSILGGLLGRDAGSVAFENNRGGDRAAPGSIGIVPQKNVFWDELNCIQNLRVWNALKRRATRNSETQEELFQLLKDCGLEGKVRELAGNLSGGEKRKLQLAIGIVGGSESTYTCRVPYPCSDSHSQYYLLMKLRAGWIRYQDALFGEY